MSKAQHTWKVSEANTEHGLYTNDGSASVISSDDKHIAFVTCQTKFKRGDGYKAQCTERDQYASLIAAAPDEHEANEFTVSELEYYIGNPSAWEHYDDAMSERLRRVVEKASAAIAKAKGE